MTVTVCQYALVTGKDASPARDTLAEELSIILDEHIDRLRSRGVSELVINELRAELDEHRTLRAG